jgi:hypothetical protein
MRTSGTVRGDWWRLCRTLGAKSFLRPRRRKLIDIEVSTGAGYRGQAGVDVHSPWVRYSILSLPSSHFSPRNVPGVFTAAAALATQRPLRDSQSDLEERPLLEAHPRLSPTVQSFAPVRLDRRLPRSA